MVTHDRVAAALNFLTGEGVENSRDSCDDKIIEALILDYFDGSGNYEGSVSDSEEATMKVQYILIMILLLYNNI